MEESTFATFTPITSFGDQNREELMRYYIENNISPENDLMKKYLNWNTLPALPTPGAAKTVAQSGKFDIGQLLGNMVFTGPEATTTSTTTSATPTSTSDIPIKAGPAPKNKKEFLEMYGPSAEEASKKSGISKDLLLAQVALETGWGKHTPGNNVGGIKASPAWKGKHQTLNTTEYENGKYVKKPQTFRAYDSPQEGFKGYVDFLMANSRYHVLKGIDDPYQAAEAMGKTGYATDISYTPKLKAIIKQIQQA